MSEDESFDDVETAVGSVVEAISQKTMTPEEQKELTKKIRKDPQAQSAIKSITTAVSPKNVQVKYCPITGKRYAPRFELCPEHNVLLKFVEQ